MFTEKDIQHLKSKGITLEEVEAQIKRISSGMSYSNLLAAATIRKGIERYSEDDIQKYVDLYESKQNELSIVKFVPASGAATRMFKSLFNFLKDFKQSNESLKEFIERQNDDFLEVFFNDLGKFPFYDEVVLKLKELYPDLEESSKDEWSYKFVEVMLSEEALNYSFFPKGLLPFHKYRDNISTAFEEHLLESTIYASSNGNSNLHFTVSKKHHDYFKSVFDKVEKKLIDTTKTTFNVSYSYQKENTETVALTRDNEVYRNEDDSILFRPAGHGALLENLNELDNDIIFIKNIDNIVVKDQNIAISKYKKLLGGVLVGIQKIVFQYLENLDNNDNTEIDFKIIALFLIHRLNVYLSPDFDTFSAEKKKAYLKGKLNRPIRVCGMVKNEGQPGGGPFWVKGEDGNVSLQIVEFAQINFSSKEQQEIVYQATHFNPTDLVCGVKNYKGKKFNLKEYVDPKAAFITMKTHNGTDIKALELPGLWNGSMADWNSVFVEVPLETFNPVKTVNDLLQSVHQESNEN